MPYSPASVLTSTASLQHIQNVVFYERTAVENLKANLLFVKATDPKILPRQSGKTLRMFTYDLFAANTTPGTEGTVGTGLTPSSQTRDVTINQYYDFVNFSDLVVETAIDPIVTNVASELGYRAALTLDALTSTEFDVAAGVTGTNIDLANGQLFTRQEVLRAVMSLQAADARPRGDGSFFGIIHPLVAFDLLNDNTAGGVTDILKYTSEGREELQRGVRNFQVVEIAGVRFHTTTKVPTTANFPVSGKTGYHTYVVGQDAVFSVSLDRIPVPNSNQSEKNFRLFINNYRGGSAADPANVIGASVAYNFKYAAIRRPGNTMTFRRIRSESSIG